MSASDPHATPDRAASNRVPEYDGATYSLAAQDFRCNKCGFRTPTGPRDPKTFSYPGSHDMLQHLYDAHGWRRNDGKWPK